jgi:hypothetical protein
MFKRNVCFIILAFILTACASQPADAPVASKDTPAISTDTATAGNDTSAASADTPAASKETTGTTETTGFTFEYGGKKIYMNEDINDVFSDIGEPRKTFEAPSCAFDGIDKIFSYSGFDLHTYPEGGKDLIHTINLRDDSIKTAEGVALGSGLSEMLKTYGDGYEREHEMYTYSKGKTRLQFLIEDDFVDAIIYLYDI